MVLVVICPAPLFSSFEGRGSRVTGLADPVPCGGGGARKKSWGADSLSESSPPAGGIPGDRVGWPAIGDYPRARWNR